MPISIVDILFKTITDLTGGLVTDLTSLIIAILGIGMICFGFDCLRDALEHSMRSAAKGRAYGEAKQYEANIENGTNQLDRDIARVRYKDAIRRAA